LDWAVVRERRADRAKAREDLLELLAVAHAPLNPVDVALAD
jgi:hypothetical protein